MILVSSVVNIPRTETDQTNQSTGEYPSVQLDRHSNSFVNKPPKCWSCVGFEGMLLQTKNVFLGIVENLEGGTSHNNHSIFSRYK